MPVTLWYRREGRNILRLARARPWRGWRWSREPAPVIHVPWWRWRMGA